MNSPRLWILILALVSGLAGFAGGRLLEPAAGPSDDSARFHEYAVRLTSTFELSPDRARALRLLLDRYERELDDLKTRQLTGLEPELARLGDTYRDRIRDKVLPEDRRAEFDRMAAGNLSSRAND